MKEYQSLAHGWSDGQRAYIRNQEAEDERYEQMKLGV